MTLSRMDAMNQRLATMGLGISISEIGFYTIGYGRPVNRIHAAGPRWVPGDMRRLADGNRLTYLVDRSDGATASGLTSDQTEAAIDSAFRTWQADSCLDNVQLVKVPDTGIDPDIVDFLLGFGDFGPTLVADIVNAGWVPRGFFDMLAPGGGRDILAVSVTYAFLDEMTGMPTDIDGDNRPDAAMNEVYYNDGFGEPGGDRAGSPWGVGMPLPAIDVETVALHENGHSLGLDHFGPTPVAVMNPTYAGVRRSLSATDHAGMCSIFGSWGR